VAPNSLRAIANTKAICSSHFADHVLEIVDLMIEPDRALADRVIVTPTLIKVSPLPQTRLIGDLSDAVKLLTALSGGVPA
jgi:circadian clock protein KaiB